MASLAKVIPVSKSDEKANEETRKFIAQCRASGRKDPPPGRLQTGYIEGLRRAATLFGDVGCTLDNLSQAEKEAGKLKGPLNKAAAWREIAWAYHRKKDVAGCRRAMQKSLESADLIPSPLAYQRAVTYASLADLSLELGDTESARQMVQKADGTQLGADLLGGLNAFTTTPLLVSVLVRVGDIRGAVAMIEKIPEREATSAWSSFATVCALEGRIDAVEKELSGKGRERLKALLCAGVVIGLQEPRPDAFKVIDMTAP